MKKGKGLQEKMPFRSPQALKKKRRCPGLPKIDCHSCSGGEADGSSETPPGPSNVLISVKEGCKAVLQKAAANFLP